MAGFLNNSPGPFGNGTSPTANGQPVPQESQAAPTPPPGVVSAVVPDQDEQSLMTTLLRRGKTQPGKLKLSSPAEEETLVDMIMQDFQDADSVMKTFKQNNTELLKNWRGMVDEKEFPFKGAANLRQPFTSSTVETMKARVIKALFGGDLLFQLNKVDQLVDADKLAEMNQWYNWELKEVVRYKNHFEDILHNVLVYGIGLSLPSYLNENTFSSSYSGMVL